MPSSLDHFLNYLSHFKENKFLPPVWFSPKLKTCFCSLKWNVRLQLWDCAGASLAPLTWSCGRGMILHLSPDSPVVLPSLKVSVRPLTRWIVDQMYCAVALKRLWPGLRLSGGSCVVQGVGVFVWGGNSNNAETGVDCIVANNGFLSWVITLTQFLLLLFRPLHVAHRMPEGQLHLREDDEFARERHVTEWWNPMTWEWAHLASALYASLT